MNLDFSETDLLLLVLSLSEGEALTPVQLQKAIFLVQEKTSIFQKARPYKFIAYDYGPFCASVYKDAAILQQKSLARIVQRANQRVRTYEITSKGQKYAEAFWGMLEKKDWLYAKQLVDWVRSQSFESLVTAVYQAYPEYRINSIFKNK